MATLGIATLKTAVDLTGLKGGLNQAHKQAKVSFSSLASVASSMLAGFTIGVSMLSSAAAGVKKLTDEAMNYGLMVSDLAGKIGTTTEEASRLLQVADDLRISNTALEMAFRFLSKKGIQPTVENLGKLADQYNALNDPVERANFLMERFGARGGLEMARMLAPGREALLAHAAAIQDGLIVTEEQVRASEDLFRAWDALKDSAQALRIMLGFELSPVLIDVLNYLNRFLIASTTLNEAMEDGVPIFLAGAVRMRDLRMEAELGEKSLQNYEGRLRKVGEAGTYASDEIYGLSVAEIEEQAVEAILAGDMAAALHFARIASEAKTAEARVRALLRALEDSMSLLQKVERFWSMNADIPEGHQFGGRGIFPGTGTEERPYLISAQPGEEWTVTPKTEVHNYNLTAQYGHQSERSLRDDIRVLELLHG